MTLVAKRPPKSRQPTKGKTQIVPPSTGVLHTVAPPKKEDVFFFFFASPTVLAVGAGGPRGAGPDEPIAGNLLELVLGRGYSL